MVPVDLVVPTHEHLCGMAGRRPVQEEGQGGKQVGVRGGMGHRALFRLGVFEIRQPLHVIPQVLARQVALETRPAECLSLVFPVECLQHRKASILPLGRYPACLVHLRPLDEAKRVPCPARRQQALRDLGRDLRHLVDRTAR